MKGIVIAVYDVAVFWFVLVSYHKIKEAGDSLNQYILACM